MPSLLARPIEVRVAIVCALVPRDGDRRTSEWRVSQRWRQNTVNYHSFELDAGEELTIRDRMRWAPENPDELRKVNVARLMPRLILPPDAMSLIDVQFTDQSNDSSVTEPTSSDGLAVAEGAMGTQTVADSIAYLGVALREIIRAVSNDFVPLRAGMGEQHGAPGSEGAFTDYSVSINLPGAPFGVLRTGEGDDERPYVQFEMYEGLDEAAAVRVYDKLRRWVISALPEFGDPETTRTIPVKNGSRSTRFEPAGSPASISVRVQRIVRTYSVFLGVNSEVKREQPKD